MCYLSKCFGCNVKIIEDKDDSDNDNHDNNDNHHNHHNNLNLEEICDIDEITKLEKYSRFKKFSYGATSKIYLTKKNKVTYICKNINKTSLRKGYREIKVLQIINSEHLSKMHEYIAFDNNIFIFMNYENSLDIHKYCFEQNDMDISKKLLISMIKQMGRAIKALHSYNFVHLDIKLENFIITDKNQVKLIDFGTVHNMREGEKNLKSILGTKNYSAPEIYRCCYHTNSDIWSYAVCVWILITKNFCFNHSKIKPRYTIENFPYELFRFPINIHINILANYNKKIKDMFEHVFKMFPIDRPQLDYLIDFDYNKYLLNNK
jgi:serine/threonine protein kinase